MSIREQAIKSVAFLSAGIILSRLFILLFRVVAARTLSLEEYGLMSLVISIFLSLGVLGPFKVDLTLSYFLNKFRGRDAESFQGLFFNGLLVTLPTMVLSLAIAVLVLFFYDIFTFNLLLVTLVFLLSRSLFSQGSGLLLGDKRIKSVSIMESLNGFTRFLLGLLFFQLLGMRSLEAGLYAFTLGFVVPALLSFVISVTHFKPTSFSINRNLLNNLFSYSSFVVVSVLSFEFVFLVPRFILSLSDLAAVAFFDMSLLVFKGVNLVLSTVPRILVPAVSDRFHTSNKIPDIRYKEILIVTLSAFLLIAILSITGVDSYLVSLVLGEKFLPFLPIFYVISLSIPFYIHLMISMSIMQGIGKANTTAKTNLFFALASIPLFYATGVFGVMGFATGVVILTIIWSGVYHLMMKNTHS